MLLYEEIKQVCEMINSNKPCMSKQKVVINKFKRDWKRVMALSGLYNKMCFTYSPNKIKLTNYGLETSIYIVPPLTFSMLENARDMIQENFGCMILFNKSKFSPFIKAKFIFNPQDNTDYKLVKQQYPWEIYIGNNYAGEPILIDVNKYVHVGEYGGTRSGKSVQQSVILTNLIANIPPEELQLYLLQVAKSDLILFSRCLHTKAFAETLEQVLQVLEYLVEIEMPRRSNLIKPYRECAKASNYRDYNALKHTEKIVMTYVCFDEMSSLFQEKDGEKKKIKDKIVFYAEEIARYGGSLGICMINSLQRPTRDNLSSLIKSQCTTVISFRQNNSKSSEVAVDDPSLALGLEQREFVYRLASKDVEYGIVPWVKDIELEKIIKPFKKTHRTLFDDLEKLSHRNGIKKNKESIVEAETHIKTENQILQENISKIPDFVPYENPTGKTIIDKTKIPSKTDKPIKKGREKIC
jgi:S-DNA-T family DNA segregation ATPase FtsK/SpoIIIE